VTLLEGFAHRRIALGGVTASRTTLSFRAMKDSIDAEIGLEVTATS
jgi:hypothetical protein